jgi:hypothetical protein
VNTAWSVFGQIEVQAIDGKRGAIIQVARGTDESPYLFVLLSHPFSFAMFTRMS